MHMYPLSSSVMCYFCSCETTSIECAMTASPCLHMATQCVHVCVCLKLDGVAQMHEVEHGVNFVTSQAS